MLVENKGNRFPKWVPYFYMKMDWDSVLVADDERSGVCGQQKFHAEVIGIFLLPLGGYSSSGYG